jgi:hypothetical protein
LLLARRASFAGLALVGYLAAVVVVGLLPGQAGISHRTLVAALAFSPADLASGRLWLLPLSGVVAEGDTWAQIALLAPAALAVVVVAGARTFWRAAIFAHVGSTFIAYAILALVEIADRPAVGDLFRDPDYGLSCVWAGAVGAFAVVVARSRANRRAKLTAAATFGVPVVALLAVGFVTPAGTLDIASVEHLFAFLLGALAGRMSPRARPAPAERGDSQPSITALSWSFRTVMSRVARPRRRAPARTPSTP